MVLCFMHALPQGDPRADPDHAGEIMFLQHDLLAINEWVIASINGNIIFLHSNPVMRLVFVVFGEKYCAGVPFKGLHSNSI